MFFQNGLWEKVSECVPCAKCTLPNVGGDMNVEWIEGTFDAKLSCFDGVIEPGEGAIFRKKIIHVYITNEFSDDQ